MVNEYFHRCEREMTIMTSMKIMDSSPDDNARMCCSDPICKFLLMLIFVVLS